MALSKTTFPRRKADEYQALREQLRHGDVLLCSGTGVFSAMIQRATGSVWSHVGIIMRLEEVDRVMLLESVEPVGVRTVRLSKYLNNYDNDGQPYPGGMVIIRHVAFPEQAPKVRQMIQAAVDRFGYPYGKRAIARIAGRIMASKLPFSRSERSRFKSDGEYICSEYVAACFETAGVKVKWNRKGFIAPADFASDERFELVGVLKKV